VKESGFEAGCFGIRVMTRRLPPAEAQASRQRRDADVGECVVRQAARRRIEQKLAADPSAILNPAEIRVLDRELQRLLVVWSKTSCGRSVVDLQEATETLAASHGPVLAHLLARKEEEVVLPLVIPLAVKVFDIRAQRGS
jgi:hypothetical protein